MIRQALDQFVRTLMSVKVVFVENHSPKAQLPESLQLIVAMMLNVLLEHDRA
jgi:hypothetical protein